MAKPPAFQFYAQDFLMGTHYMTSAEVGAYIRLLARSWDKGPVPLAAKDRAHWLFSSRGDLADPAELWAKIAHKWVKTPAGYINKRLESIRDKYTAYIAMQSEKGRRSAEVRAAKSRTKTRKLNRGSTTVQFGSTAGQPGAIPRTPKPASPRAQAHTARTDPPETTQKPEQNRGKSRHEPRFNRGSTEVQPEGNSSIFKLEDQDQTQDQDHAFGVDERPVETVENRPKPSHQHLVRVAHDVIALAPEGSGPGDLADALKSAAAKLGLVYDGASVARAVAVASIQAQIKRGEARPPKSPPPHRAAQR